MLRTSLGRARDAGCRRLADAERPDSAVALPGSSHQGLAHSPAGSRLLQLLPSDHHRASSFRLQQSARRGTEPPPPDPHQCTRFGAAAGTSGCRSEEKRQGQLLCPQTNSSFPCVTLNLGFHGGNRLSLRPALASDPVPSSGLLV